MTLTLKNKIVIEKKFWEHEIIKFYTATRNKKTVSGYF